MKKYNKHIIIAGSARSGTSWLAEIIAKTFRYRLLFEPDHENHVPQAKELLTDKYLSRPPEKDLDIFLRKVFGNKLDNDWIAQNSNRKFKMHLLPFLPKKYIIKLIRSNLSIKQINAYYGIPVIFIVRNPYEVVFSQNRVKFPWLYNLSYFQSQPALVDYIKEKTTIDIRKTTFSNIEKLTLRWCIENVIPLQWEEGFINKAEVIKYEELKGNIEKFKTLASNFNIDLHPEISTFYARPSSKTHPKSTIIKEKEFQNTLSIEEQKAVKTILQDFGVILYDI